MHRTTCHGNMCILHLVCTIMCIFPPALLTPKKFLSDISFLFQPKESSGSRCRFRHLCTTCEVDLQLYPATAYAIAPVYNLKGISNLILTVQARKAMPKTSWCSGQYVLFNALYALVPRLGPHRREMFFNVVDAPQVQLPSSFSQLLKTTKDNPLDLIQFRTMFPKIIHPQIPLLPGDGIRPTKHSRCVGVAHRTGKKPFFFF